MKKVCILQYHYTQTRGVNSPDCSGFFYACAPDIPVARLAAAMRAAPCSV